MKNSQAFCISLVLLSFWQSNASKQLDEFLKSVNDVQSELHWLDHVPLNEVYRRKRSASIEDLLARFEFADDDVELEESDLESGDAWYQSFRAMECQYGGCPKKPLRWKVRKAQTDDYDEYDEEADEPIKDLKDQWEETPNDLSHEANYKLSKVEQDAVEKSLPDTAWPVRHNPKRNVDPMQEVKLKTSLRMLNNGDGASLPSSAIEEDRQQITVNAILADTKHEENREPWEDSIEMMEGRRLLSVEDPEDERMSGKMCGSKKCRSHNLDMQQFDNIKQKSDLDRQFEGVSFDNTDTGSHHSTQKKGTLTKLSDDLMHSTAFLKLQSFLKGKSGATNKTTPDLKTTTSRPVAAVPLNLVDKDRDVNIKLHMSVNATVLGNGNLPAQFSRNNTITFKPPTVKKKKRILGLNDFDLDRDRRAVVFPILTGNSKRRVNDHISKSVIEATEDFPLDELITGKLTSQLVNTIFALVKSSPSLKVLWPGLMRNKVTSGKQVQNFYAIRTHDNESEMHRTEVMLRQAMETINAIIEQQVRSRSCVPLRADLKAFYNLILATKAETDQLQDRKKRATEGDYSTASMTATGIQKKSRIVKKLLKDYEELPREDQDQVAGIKESLLLAAEKLNELSATARRRKRQIIQNRLLDNNTSLFQQRDLDTQLTPQYLKLARAAEMFLHSSVEDPDLPFI